MKQNKIEIYQLDDGHTEIEVQVVDETLWLSQKQMAELFGKDTDTVSLHLKQIYSSGEISEKATTEYSSVVRLEGSRNVKRRIKVYNLDAVLSVGYRVNSKRGTQFRIWANKILRDYLMKGFSLNEKRLRQKNEELIKLKEAVKIIGDVLNSKALSGSESIGLLKIISDYAYALDILDQYDYQKLVIQDTSVKASFQLTYEDAISQIQIAKKAYGNKRIAAFIFLYFLDKNGILVDQSGGKRIPDNALVAITLMIAISKPEDKETMIKVVVNLINQKN